MKEVKADRKPTRDYSVLSETPWTLWEVMFARRSHRKYLPTELDDKFITALDDFLSIAADAREALPNGIIAVKDPAVGVEIRKRAYGGRGLSNKINLWLARSPVKAFLVTTLPVDDVKSSRPREMPKVIMAVEDCVLWLTEQGFGTCWLAGVNPGEMQAILGLDTDLATPVAISFGRPVLKPPAVSYGNLLLHTMSRWRKPLSKIAYLETTGKPYAPADIGNVRFTAGAKQDISGLLELVRDGRVGGDVPLGLAVEACLEAARIAPSGGNAQAWHFIVIKDEKRLEKLVDACGDGADWRVAIVAAGDQVSTGLPGLFDKPFWMIDVPIALSHMSLMAASMGCAAQVLTDGIDEEAINSLVGLSSSIRTVGVMGIS